MSDETTEQKNEDAIAAFTAGYPEAAHKKRTRLAEIAAEIAKGGKANPEELLELDADPGTFDALVASAREFARLDALANGGLDELAKARAAIEAQLVTLEIEWTAVSRRDAERMASFEASIREAERELVDRKGALEKAAIQAREDEANAREDVKHLGAHRGRIAKFVETGLA